MLDDALMDISRAFNESCIGKTTECLNEGADKTGHNLIARTPFMQQVIVSANANEAPSMIDINITSANKCSLRGEIKK